MKYNISLSDSDIRAMAEQSHAMALKMIDSILEANAGPSAVPQKSPAPAFDGDVQRYETFGSFRDSADNHPLLNKILCGFLNCPFTGTERKIPAIKFVRSVTGWGLADSKKFVESAKNELGMKVFP